MGLAGRRPAGCGPAGCCPPPRAVQRNHLIQPAAPSTTRQHLRSAREKRIRLGAKSKKLSLIHISEPTRLALI
eukprot:13923648-Alexandrium_andersonii.AAC.1